MWQHVPLFKQRLFLAVTTLPTLTGWLLTLALFLATTAVTVHLGRRSGFLTTNAPRLAPQRVTRLLLVAWLSPALVEEILFRALPLPHLCEDAPLTVQVGWSLLALAVFVGAHPLRTVLRPLPRNRVFTDRRFLLLATLLGAACTGAYLATGSVWAPVGIHYLLVAGWLIRFGGWQKITDAPSSP